MKPIKWKTEKRKIKELIPHKTNPREMTDEQRDALQESISKFDLAEIPAINTNNRILAGHQRLSVMAAMGRGDEEIDVRVPIRKLTAAEEKEYLIRSNKNQGQFDFNMLAEQFDQQDLQDWEIGRAHV